MISFITKPYLKLMVLSIILFSTNIFAQDVPQYKLDDVVVSAGRTPVSINNLARDVTIIGPKELKNIPVTTVQELLQYTTGIDIKSRGAGEVQSDISIRGGTFEQTLILIDGIKIIDPQTGHHNLNLPISLDDVERVEIIKGQASSVFGPNAFSGAINIITKKSGKSLNLKTEGGENQFYNYSLGSSYTVGKINQRISFSKKKSDGYRFNTDFDILNFSYGANLNLNKGAVNFLFGYNEKDFGANSFYSLRFPNQGEKTLTKLFALSGLYSLGDIILSAKSFYRTNYDDFVLNNDNHAFYRNVHHTKSYGGEIQTTYKTKRTKFSVGGEFSEDAINSNNLGERLRNKKGVFGEINYSGLKNFNAVLGGFAYKYTDIDWKIWPGLDLSYSLSRNVKVFSSIGKAFRIPTYTELFYNDPATVGNPNLKPEETTNMELGIKYMKPSYSVGVSAFRKQGKNIIDWVKVVDADPWSVRNIAEVNTNGFEFNGKVFINNIIKKSPVKEVSVGYTYLDSDKKTEELISRYVLTNLRHQISLTILNEWFLGINQIWNFNYQDRLNFEDSFIVDSKISKSFKQFEVYVRATNLLNKTVYDFNDVPLPGRWVFVGIDVSVL